MADQNSASIQKRWYIRNEDTGEIVQGQFPAEMVEKSIKNSWEQHTALSRSRSITQFINSESDKLNFSSMFFASDSGKFEDVQSKIQKLESWAKASLTGPPPVVTFWVGNGHLERTCVIDSMASKYMEPASEGDLRHVVFTINFLAYDAFSLSDTELFETRYHRGRERDYYEMLCFREYKLPLLGDVIRKRNPEQPQVTPGSIIPLPSVEAIRSEKVEPKSVPLATAFGRKDTPQRALRIDMFNRRNRPYTSHIVR